MVPEIMPVLNWFQDSEKAATDAQKQSKIRPNKDHPALP
jgi:hypothetical protein